jgi:hypothetical protein
MSDHFMIIIPMDPFAKPSEERCQAALDRLCELRTGYEPELEFFDKPEFIWAAESAGGVFCPFCAADIESWFFEELRYREERGQQDLVITTPCCARSTSFNDLDFEDRQGFACVTMEINCRGADLESFEREEIEAVLGVPVRVIWRHL